MDRETKLYRQIDSLSESEKVRRLDRDRQTDRQIEKDKVTKQFNFKQFSLT